MKTKTIILSLFFIVSTTAFISCSKDESAFARVNLSAGTTDFDGDVIGDGGTTSKSYDWNNSLATADWNMDMTATIGGEFQLIIKDSEGTSVLNQTLVKGQGDDSRSGVTTAGAPGMWNITIVLNSFNGDGSFSISPGN